MQKSVKFDEGRAVNFKMINSRLMKITPINKDYEILDDNGEIIGLQFNKTNKILINKDTQHLGPFKPLQIKKITSKNVKEGAGYFLYSHKLSKSSQFTLPMLGNSREYFKWNTSLCNVFLGTEDGSIKNRILLLYRMNTSKEYLEFEAMLENHPMYVKSHAYDVYHDLVEFRVPERFKEDYTLLINGKYSQISEELKKRIVKFHYLTSNSPISQVIHKSETRRKKLEKDLKVDIPEDLDLLDPYNIENELCSDKYMLEYDEEQENLVV